jgi:hypothetical protein
MVSVKNTILFLVILSSLGFYFPRGVSEFDMSWKLAYYFFCICFLITTIFKSKQTITYHPEFRIPFSILFFSIVFSIIMGQLVHSQFVLVGFMSTLPYATYGIYFLLKYNKIQVNIVERFIIGFGLLSVIISVIAILTFPNSLFGSPEIDIKRGGFVRPRCVGGAWIALLFFYSIEHFIKTKKRYYLLMIFICYLGLVTSLARQVILVSSFLGIMFFLYHQKFKYQIVVLVCVLFIAVFWIPRLEFFQDMVELTKTQKEMNLKEEDIRVQGWKYFTYEGQSNLFTHLFGNGVFSVNHSKYGSKLAKTGFFPADESWAGYYFYFGGISTVCLLLIFKNGILKRQSWLYPNLYLLYTFVLSFASGPLVYPNSILVIVIALYIKSIKQDSLG